MSKISESLEVARLVLQLRTQSVAECTRAVELAKAEIARLEAAALAEVPPEFPPGWAWRALWPGYAYLIAADGTPRFTRLVWNRSSGAMRIIAPAGVAVPFEAVVAAAARFGCAVPPGKYITQGGVIATVGADDAQPKRAEWFRCVSGEW